MNDNKEQDQNEDVNVNEPQNDANAPNSEQSLQVPQTDDTAPVNDTQETSSEVVVGSVHNKRKTYIIVGILVALLIAAGATLLLLNNKETKPTTQTAQTTDSQQEPTATAIVTITADSFSPATVEIKKGTAVTWKNTDTADHQPAADPYPTNTSLPEWGKGEVLKTNDEFTYQFEKSGTYTYQDNLNPYKIKGTVIVKD